MTGSRGFELNRTIQAIAGFRAYMVCLKPHVFGHDVLMQSDQVLEQVLQLLASRESAAFDSGSFAGISVSNSIISAAITSCYAL